MRNVGGVPVGIGIALVLGVVLNYVADPIGNAPLLFGGVLLVVLAITLDAVAYRKCLAARPGSAPRDSFFQSPADYRWVFSTAFVAASMYADFTRPEAGKLGPYGAVFVFAVGIFISNFLLNTLMMKKTFVGTPVTYADYFKGGLGTHLTGILVESSGYWDVVQHYRVGTGGICDSPMG